MPDKCRSRSNRVSSLAQALGACVLLSQFLLVGCNETKHRSSSERPLLKKTPNGDPAGVQPASADANSKVGQTIAGKTVAFDVPPDEAKQLGSMCADPANQHVVGFDTNRNVVCAPNIDSTTIVNNNTKSSIIIAEQKLERPLLPKATAVVCITVNPGNNEPGMPYGPGTYGKDFGFQLDWQILGGAPAEKFIMRFGYFWAPQIENKPKDVFIELDRVEVSGDVRSISYPTASSPGFRTFDNYLEILYTDVELYVYLRAKNAAGEGPETERVSVQCKKARPE